MNNIKIGIALGGGGMCGIAHIGFLQVLEENGIKPNMMSGISMGSIVAGLYSSGYTPREIEELALRLSKSDFIKINIFHLIDQSLLSGEKIEQYLSKIIKVKNIEEAPIRFFAEAVEIKSGKVKIFKKGSFAEAMHASSAIPGIIAPLCKKNAQYVDGGIAENVPFNVLKQNGADVVIAINCLGEYTKPKKIKGIFKSIANSFDCMQTYMWKQSKQLFKNNYDIYCFDRLQTITPLETDLSKIPQLIEFGRKCGEIYLDRIKEIIEKKQKKIVKNT